MDSSAIRRASEAHAMRMGETRESAEEIAQDALLRLERHPAEGDATTYVIRITRNLVIDAQRFRSRRPQTSVWDAALEDTTPLIEAEDDPVVSDETRAMFSALVRTLPDELRTVVLMAISGRRYREIAAEMMIPVGTVRSRLHRARRQMRGVAASLTRSPL